MRAVVQRVKNCRIVVEDRVVGEIVTGLLVYLGVSQNDTTDDADYMVRKISSLRIFEDDDGQMNLSVQDTHADICVVSQFTLYGDARKGNRPSYSHAARPETAVPLYEYCVDSFIARGFRTACGEFGAHMDVSYTNDGPVTILMDSDKTF